MFFKCILFHFRGLFYLIKLISLLLHSFLFILFFSYSTFIIFIFLVIVFVLLAAVT